MSETQENKTGWSWKGFFFAPYYYAGYGKLLKGIWLAVVTVLLPVIGLIAVAIVGGKYARKELTIGEVDFNWKNVGIVLAIAIPLSIGSQWFIANMQGKTPSCSASETKEIVIQIAKEELAKQGYSKSIPNLEFEVANIRTSSYNESVDIYQCSADFKVIGKDTNTLPITYSVQATDDRKNFYVEVNGF